MDDWADIERGGVEVLTKSGASRSDIVEIAPAGKAGQ
jgi:hypothetical protein